MAVKIFCDYCEKEITKDKEVGKLVRAYEMSALVAGNRNPIQSSVQRDEFNLCRDCLARALQALNNK